MGMSPIHVIEAAEDKTPSVADPFSITFNPNLGSALTFLHGMKQPPSSEIVVSATKIPAKAEEGKQEQDSKCVNVESA